MFGQETQIYLTSGYIRIAEYNIRPIINHSILHIALSLVSLNPTFIILRAAAALYPDIAGSSFSTREWYVWKMNLLTLILTWLRMRSFDLIPRQPSDAFQTSPVPCMFNEIPNYNFHQIPLGRLAYEINSSRVRVMLSRCRSGKSAWHWVSCNRSLDVI